MRDKARIVGQADVRVTIEVPNRVRPDRPHRLDVDVRDYWKWQQGAYVQDAFPYLDAGQREILVTGIGPDDWPTVVGDDPSPRADYVALVRKRDA